MRDSIAEEWKSVPYNNRYEVSNYGGIRRVCKKFIKPLIPTDNGNGYKIICLSRNGIKKNFYIHRLVAEAFLYQEPGKNYIHHLDHNRANNTAWNLRWCTQKENVLESLHLMPRFRKVKNPEMYGIQFKKNKYEVAVKRYYIGRFENLDDAKRVRDLYVDKIKKQTDG